MVINFFFNIDKLHMPFLKGWSSPWAIVDWLKLLYFKRINDAHKKRKKKNEKPS